ncbi:phosphate ABC transporter permease PstA [Sulfuriflexus sp.]|uniref:phosphate ABC transporter permease PstA n=1 Tax=Sulfuriflexus sp. TaxID=2015443 RepID=UPI0028CE18BD|nr:phosphate ABC transporter permease PstA [Sulfuriflexus sp.]MDT8403877.1 phosphate ABC transporter permease PstA [Sulfuriflexus sp.]
MKSWFKSGSPWVWLSAAAVSISLIMVFGLLILIAMRGLGYFWPADVLEIEYREADNRVVQIIGEIQGREKVTAERIRSGGGTIPEGVKSIDRLLIKIGNRDITGLDFRWVDRPNIISEQRPQDLLAVERHEWGNLYGYLIAVKQQGKLVAEQENAWPALHERLVRTRQLFAEVRDIQKGVIGAINYQIEELRMEKRRLELDGVKDPAAYKDIAARRETLNKEFLVLQKRLDSLYQQMQRDSMVVKVANGREVDVPLSKIVRAYRPNAMGVFDKSLHYLEKAWEFVSDEPREANTEGGVFPAIFGTVLMVIIMSILVTPFGVIAAVYLREYAKQGPVTRIIRIAVNNLAGVPSIVYGVFGLGFFVYFLGGNIDQLFYPEALPAPTFGTPGILWASLTLALLTLPVVIVATEEGLARIPRSIREGSLALGATKAETLWRIVLPMASPALMTGMILAIARAAGEVAPLMLVGVVKLAPSLPLDMNAPFLHLDRKFMTLGFHIYDVGFQSPNVEAARPLVYATALLLVAVIVILNLAAIRIRNNLREKYKALD